MAGCHSFCLFFIFYNIHTYIHSITIIYTIIHQSINQSIMKQDNYMTHWVMQTQFCDAAVEISTVLHCNSTYTPTRSPAFSSNRLKRARIQIFGHFVRKRTGCIFLLLFTSSELNLVESLLPECPAPCVVPHLSQPNNHLKSNMNLNKIIKFRKKSSKYLSNKSAKICKLQICQSLQHCFSLLNPLTIPIHNSCIRINFQSDSVTRKFIF